MSIAFVFPGQGSQAVGMGKALAEAFRPARAVFDEVDAALSEKLTATMWEGPADKLTLTENAQPALMAVSLAVMRVLEAEAGSISSATRSSSPAIRSVNIRRWRRRAPSRIADTARLLRMRGRAMQEAVPVGIGAMAALLGLELRGRGRGRGRGRAGRGLSGRERQWRRPGGGVRQQGGGRARGRDRQGQGRQARHDAAGVGAIPLRADAACRRRHGRGAGQNTVKPPAVPVVANVLAKPISDPAEIVRRLVEQVTGTVRWRECVAYMAARA